MLAPPEAGRQPGAVDGGAHEGLPGALAGGVEVAVAPVVAGEAVDGQGLAAQGQLGVDDAPFVDLAAAFQEALVHDLEAVAGADVALEINVPGIGAHHLDQHRVRHPGPRRVGE